MRSCVSLCVCVCASVCYLKQLLYPTSSRPHLSWLLEIGHARISRLQCRSYRMLWKYGNVFPAVTCSVDKYWFCSLNASLCRAFLGRCSLDVGGHMLFCLSVVFVVVLSCPVLIIQFSGDLTSLPGSFCWRPVFMQSMREKRKVSYYNQYALKWVCVGGWGRRWGGGGVKKGSHIMLTGRPCLPLGLEHVDIV